MLAELYSALLKHFRFFKTTDKISLLYYSLYLNRSQPYLKKNNNFLFLPWKKLKLLFSMSSHPAMFLTVFNMFFFLFKISCQDFYFMWHTICWSASLHMDSIWCELMTFAGGWSYVLECSWKEREDPAVWVR